MFVELTKNERGFMLLSAIFLTLIVSIMATILLHANVKVQQRNSTLYLTAINLANEQFALLEIDTSLEIPDDDKKSYNGLSGNAAPVVFRISKIHQGDRQYTVKVEWTVDGETETFESTKTILAENDE